MNKKQLASEIKKAVSWLKKEDCGCSTIKLDDKLAVCVGWLDGYDEDDSTCVHSKSEPSWCINVGIKVHISDSMRTDYEYINAPYFDSGDVWSTDVSISKKERYMELASYLLAEYEAMKKCVIEDDGRIDNFRSPEDYCSGLAD